MSTQVGEFDLRGRIRGQFHHLFFYNKVLCCFSVCVCIFSDEIDKKVICKLLVKSTPEVLEGAQVLDELDVHTPERHELLQVDHRRGHVEVK